MAEQGTGLVVGGVDLDITPSLQGIVVLALAMAGFQDTAQTEASVSPENGRAKDFRSLLLRSTFRSTFQGKNQPKTAGKGRTCLLLTLTEVLWIANLIDVFFDKP
jgi:hypothetical protein